MSSKKRVQVWTDGSCINNGKDSAKCGIGIYYGEEDVRNASVTLNWGRQTNNRAELCAILYVLCTNSGRDDLTILTDSRYSMDCITRYMPTWRANNWVTSKNRAPESLDILKYIDKLIASRLEYGGETSFVHVAAHADSLENNSADALARESTSMQKSNKFVRALIRQGVPL